MSATLHHFGPRPKVHILLTTSLNLTCSSKVTLHLLGIFYLLQKDFKDFLKLRNLVYVPSPTTACFTELKVAVYTEPSKASVNYSDWEGNLYRKETLQSLRPSIRTSILSLQSPEKSSSIRRKHSASLSDNHRHTFDRCPPAHAHTCTLTLASFHFLKSTSLCFQTRRLNIFSFGTFTKLRLS